LPLPPFRDINDPDEKRREIVWIAISFIVILASWFAVVLIFGYRPLIMGMTYDEVVLSVGLTLLMFCTLVYLTAREREQRGANKALLAQLNGAVASLDERVEQLDGLCAASAELAGSLDIEHISRSVVEAVVQALQPDQCYLTLFDQETGKLVYKHCSPPVAGLGALASLDDELPLDRSGACLALDAGFEQWNKARTTIRAPIRLIRGLFGVLGAQRSRQRGQFTPAEMRLLTTLANMTAKAIESAQLHADLRDSYLATVTSLVNSLHARDNYTASHSARVASLAVRMAQYLGLPESIITEIEVFGPLHDVGKIGIPDHILMKPRPLSQPERKICREHCIIGERILRPLRPSREALAMVRNHHEAWDGSGYPDGLAGEDIPLLARLLQTADSYDAMISERPYQEALSEQEVLSHFRQYAGVLYDPVAAKALCAVAATGERPQELRVEQSRNRGVEESASTFDSRSTLRLFDSSTHRLAPSPQTLAPTRIRHDRG
jgi:HD-GYP domain-containing protein (c-di-GMP phosphodiesterase class II)